MAVTPLCASAAIVSIVTFARVVVIAAGLLGILGCFLPLDAGSRATVCDAVRGIEYVHDHVTTIDGSTELASGFKRDSGILLRLLQLAFLLIALPSAALIGLGWRGVHELGIGMAGWCAVGCGVANLWLAAPFSTIGPGRVLFAVSGLLAIAAGIACIKSTRVEATSILRV